MKILITENQFKKLIENIIKEEETTAEREIEKIKLRRKMEDWFLEEILDNIEERINPEYPGFIFYNDKIIRYLYMYHDQKNKELWVDYNTIWRYFETNYSNNYKEIEELMKHLVGEYMGLSDLTVQSYSSSHRLWMGEHILIEQDNIINPDLEKYKKESDAKLWFYENIISKIEEKTHPEYPNVIFYINKNSDEIIMQYNKKNRALMVNYNPIWSYFEKNYSYKNKEIRQLIEILIAEYYTWHISFLQIRTGGLGRWENI